MSYASAQSAFAPTTQLLDGQFNLVSGTDVTFFNDVLPKGSYLITGVVEVSSSANLDNIFTSALNGIQPTKLVLFGIDSTALDAIFAPFTLFYFSDGIEPTEISVDVSTAGAVNWEIGNGGLVQIQRLS